MFKNIGKLIRTKRLSSPEILSQSELAAKFGYKNGQFISNIERGIAGVPFENMKKFSDILGISKEEMMEALMLDLQMKVGEIFTDEPSVIQDQIAEEVVQ